MGVGIDTLAASKIEAEPKFAEIRGKASSLVSAFQGEDLVGRGVKSPKMLSSAVPGLHIPDYGSAMTSTIYFRGFGSRMDNPVLGMYVDGVPLMDKNLYDFEFFDVKRVDVLRGPQGTLFGRNSMCGVMNVSTLSARDYQGSRISVEAGSSARLRLQYSLYKNNNSFSLAFSHSDGFYRNEYLDEPCDRSNSLQFRHRHHKLLGSGWDVDNIISASAVIQGGWPYRQSTGSGLQPVLYDEPCSYKRFSAGESLRFRRSFDNFSITSVSALQLMYDSMHIDNDFSSSPVFTLTQTQRQVGLTQEIMAIPREQTGNWNHITGAFLHAKYNQMSAPVTMMRSGIEDLILANANAGIPDELGDLLIRNDNLPILSDFGLAVLNAAAFHESYFSLGNWKITAGLRIDYELNTMCYDSRAELDFMVSGIMADYYHYSDNYDGSSADGYFQILPKLAASYDIPGLSAGNKLEFFAIVSKGSKAGGFNTQIFSDILQNRLMTGMMGKLGITMAGKNGGPGAGATVYRPEYMWNYEAGLRFILGSEEGRSLSGGLSVYDAQCRDLQMTVFPPGKSTGRMMVNAGRASSAGIELTLGGRWKDYRAILAYSSADARFTDGENAGRHVPYSPASTLFSRIEYSGAKVGAGLDLGGVGKIYWNEENTLSQPFYACLGMDVSYKTGKLEFLLRAENILQKEYRVFYFKSMGNEFFQMGKPARFSLRIKYSMI